MVTIMESDKIIFVNIKNSYEALRNNDRSNPLYRDSVYNCTVKYWRIGCYKGKVIEVVRIKSVSSVTSGEYAGRKIFEGIEERQSPYMGLDIRELFDTLANFNTKYWNF